MTAVTLSGRCLSRRANIFKSFCAAHSFLLRMSMLSSNICWFATSLLEKFVLQVESTTDKDGVTDELCAHHRMIISVKKRW